MVFSGPGWSPGTPATQSATSGGTSDAGRLGHGSAEAEYRMWNFDVFAQDSWKLRPNLTFEYGMRAGYWTNNAELNGLGAYFDPGRTTRRRRSTWIRAPSGS